MILRHLLEIGHRSCFAGELLVVIAQERGKSRIPDLLSKHVKDHGALVHDHGGVLRSKGREAPGLGNWRAIVIHQGADGKIVERLVHSVSAGGLLHVQRFGISRQSVRQPDVGGRCGHDLIPPPLGGHEIGQLSRVSRRAPLALAEEQQTGRGISGPRAVGNLCDCQIGLGQRTKLIGKGIHDARNRAAVFLRRTCGAGRQVNGNI